MGCLDCREHPFSDTTWSFSCPASAWRWPRNAAAYNQVSCCSSLVWWPAISSCARLGPEMIDSPIHRQGGPVFFALSLVPFFLLLIVLWKSDQVREKIKPKRLG